MSSAHDGVQCDGCKVSAFQYRRYKCLRCADYDLCGGCFDNQRETGSHEKNHPMQCLILESDYNTFYQNINSNGAVLSCTCPICGALGFLPSELGQHVFEKHSASRIRVICPLCVLPSRDGDSFGPGGNANKYHTSFGQHLIEAHCFKMPVISSSTGHLASVLKKTSSLDSDGSSDDVEISFHNGASNHEKLRRGRRNLRAQNGLEISYRNGHKELAGLFKAPLDGKRYRLRQQPLSSLTQKLQVEPLENISAPQTENHSTNLIVLPQKDDPKSGGVMARSNGAATKKNRTLLSPSEFKPGSRAAAGDSQLPLSNADITNNCNSAKDTSTPNQPTPLATTVSSQAGVSTKTPPTAPKSDAKPSLATSRKSSWDQNVDIFDEEWCTFVQELIFDSLRITGLATSSRSRAEDRDN